MLSDRGSPSERALAAPAPTVAQHSVNWFLAQRLAVFLVWVIATAACSGNVSDTASNASPDQVASSTPVHTTSTPTPPLPDDAFSDLFASGRGRRTQPADVIASVLVLQSLERLSDREATKALATDLRWKVACGLSITDAGFHPTTLTQWRNRLRKPAAPRPALVRRGRRRWPPSQRPLIPCGRLPRDRP